MKKIISILLSILVLSMTFVVANAESAGYDSENLLEKYSTYEIINMYPEFSSYLADEFRTLNTDISIEDFEIPIKYIDAIYFSVLSENPDIFYVSPSDFESTSDSDTDILVAVRPVYLFKAGEIPDKTAEFNKAVDYILSGVDDSWSDTYKCRYLHDMIAQYVHYDMNYENPDMLIRTAYGALVGGNAVCEGYTLAYNYLLGKLGIESHFIQSTKMLHAWSYVKLGKNYYHVDVTYDDPSYDNLGRVNHDYCLVSDKQLGLDGVHHDWVYKEKAESTSFDNVWWRKINSIIFPIDGYDYYTNQTYSSSVYGALLRRNIETGESSLIKQVFTRWNVEGSSNVFWERSYCYLTYDGKYLYFNDTGKIYRHKPNGSTDYEIIYKKPDSIKHHIYGVAMQRDGKLYATMKENPNVEDVIYFIDRNAPAQKPEPDDNNEPTTTSPTSPTSPTSSPTTPNPTNPTPPTNPTAPNTTVKKRTTIKKSVSMYVKQTGSITPASNEKFTYSSDKKSVATVNSKGKITAKKKGSATITATSKSYIYKIKVTVKNPTLSPTKKTIKKGKTFKLKIKGAAGKIKYTSDNKKVASVSNKGKVTAKKKGSATITVKTNGSIKLKCKVTVK